MRIENLDLGEIHRIAKRAVDNVIDAAERAGHALDEFYEDQLVYEIGNVFRASASPKSGKLFPYFKFPYPDGKRTDVLVEGFDIDDTKHCVWIEVKFRTRLCERQWREDLAKLRKPRKNQYAAVHHGYWIYLYVFETRAPEYIKHFGEERVWKRHKTKQMAYIFERYDGRKKLGKNLSNIDKAFRGNTLCSIIPSLPSQGESLPRFGLLVTAQAK